MKHIISSLFLLFFLIGCASNQQTVDMNVPTKNQNNANLGKEIGKTDNLGTPIEKEEISVFEPIDIKESEITVLEYKQDANIAFTYPSKVVGRYAKSSMSTMQGFYDYKKINYNIKVFDSINETQDSIFNTFEKIKESGITKVIALYSPKAIEILHSLDTSGLEVYLPLTNINEVVVSNDNFIYGGISYEKQINKLFEYSNVKNTMFYQSSFLGKKLKEKYELLVPSSAVIKEVKNKRNYFKGLVKDYRLNGSTLFLNTNLVKSSILLSQFTVYDVKPRVILSTQVNFNPKLMSLTQVRDRQNLVVANSIDQIDDTLEDTINTYGADVKYNWVDYSTLVGVNYLYDYNESGLILTQIQNNQVNYEPKLFKSTAFGFLEIK